MKNAKSSPTPDDALDYLNKGSLVRAVSACEKILKQNPQSIQTWFVLALASHELGKHEQAIDAYQHVISLNPELPEACYNLGVLQRTVGQTAAAATNFRRALELRPHWADAQNNLGNCLLDSHDFAGAANCYQQAIQIDGHHSAAWLNLSNLIVKGRLHMEAENALAVCERAVKLNPQVGQAYYNLGIVLDKQYLVEDALAAIERAVELNPANKMWKADLSARKGDTSNSRLPQEYIAELFDAYADRFDSHLLNNLQYQVPQLVFDKVTESAPDGLLDILDLGCGTGLCGELFKSRSKSLVGIDLSPKMIDAAREKHAYTTLHVGSINTVMASEKSLYDLVLAADVFVYIGDLSETFAKVCQVLRPGGLFAFSVEKFDGEGFTLQVSRRFAYSLNYLHGLMKEYGFLEVTVTTGSLRKEAGNDVLGYILVVRK